MNTSPFMLRLPETVSTSVIFASPHSGRTYPESFLGETVLDERTVRSSEDAFVDDLIAVAPELGAASILANVPRAFVDLNRGPDELDPAVIAGLGRVIPSPRIASGLGVIPRVVSNGRAIYRGKISRAEADMRLERYWHPYHARLQGLLVETRARFGEAILVDCHSMPHEALESLSGSKAGRPDVVLGDRFGAAAGNEVVERIEAAFATAGLRVVRNAPFAGAYVSQAYGRPAVSQHAVQIEIDRALYMDEERILPHSGYAAFKHLLTGILADIADIGRPPVALAAE